MVTLPRTPDVPAQQSYRTGFRQRPDNLLIVKPPTGYHGAKTQMAPWILEHVPDHETYVEPFAGSLAVLFAKPRAPFEIVNDLDDGVVTFMRCLRDIPDELARVCRLTPYSRQEHALADLDAPDMSDLELARRWWVRVSQGTGRLPVAQTGWHHATSIGTSTTVTVQSRIDRFATLSSRLSTVMIEHRPALDIIAEHAPNPNAAIYLDPPYVGDTRGGHRPAYRHEMTIGEHAALLETVTGNDVKAAIVISGYPSPMYEQSLDDWYQANWEASFQPVNASDDRNNRVERLWTNREPASTVQEALF